MWTELSKSRQEVPIEMHKPVDFNMDGQQGRWMVWDSVSSADDVKWKSDTKRPCGPQAVLFCSAPVMEQERKAIVRLWEGGIGQKTPWPQQKGGRVGSGEKNRSSVHGDLGENEGKSQRNVRVMMRKQTFEMQTNKQVEWGYFAAWLRPINKLSVSFATLLMCSKYIHC